MHKKKLVFIIVALALIAYLGFTIYFWTLAKETESVLNQYYLSMHKIETGTLEKQKQVYLETLNDPGLGGYSTVSEKEYGLETTRMFLKTNHIMTDDLKRIVEKNEKIPRLGFSINYFEISDRTIERVALLLTLGHATAASAFAVIMMNHGAIEARDSNVKLSPLYFSKKIKQASEIDLLALKFDRFCEIRKKKGAILTQDFLHMSDAPVTDRIFVNRDALCNKTKIALREYLAYLKERDEKEPENTYSKAYYAYMKSYFACISDEYRFKEKCPYQE